MFYLHFWAGFLKDYCQVGNEDHRIYLTERFRAKMKILKPRTKNALFVYFWTGI